MGCFVGRNQNVWSVIVHVIEMTAMDLKAGGTQEPEIGGRRSPYEMTIAYPRRAVGAHVDRTAHERAVVYLQVLAVDLVDARRDVISVPA